MALFQDQRKVRYVRTIANTYTVLRTEKIIGSPTTLRLKVGKATKTFDFDSGKPLYREGRTWYYFVDIIHGQVEKMGSLTEVSADLNDVFMARKTIEKLVAGIEKPEFMAYLLYVILSIGVGLAAGYILGNALPLKG